MRRLLVGLLAFLGLTGTILILPVYAAPSPEPEPVKATTEELDMGSVAAPAPQADVQQGTTDPVAGVAPSTPTLTITREEVDEFSLVGVTWAFDAGVIDTVVQVRVKDSDDAWGEWTEVTVEDAEQSDDADSGAQLRGGTSPLWTGPSTGVEVELVTRSGAQPTDVQLNLVDPGRSAADATVAGSPVRDEAGAALSMPTIFSRQQWGADERIRTWAPEYAPTIKAATLHYTAGSNDYTPDQVPAILRSIYQYHAVDRGWGDIGYNVLVDKFGRAWEGRYGGLASTVIAAHAGGFNTGTFGISMIGNFDQVDIPAPVLPAVAAVVAWKLSLFGVDPRGSVTLTSGGGGTAKYAAGVSVTLPTVFGHRDVGNTADPGRYGYPRLPELRTLVASLMGGGPLITPSPYRTIAARLAAEPSLGNWLGSPTGSPQTANGVTWQDYPAGRMYQSTAGGVRFIGGDILAAYLAAGGPAALGAPASDELGARDGRGRMNHFTGGASIYWTTTTGARVIMGAIRDRWGALGWESSLLGYPTSAEQAGTGGARYSTFERGAIWWSAAGGAHAVMGDISTKWSALGGQGWAGLPMTDELGTGDGVGRFNDFGSPVAASIYWTPATGAHAVQGAIRDRWVAQGREAGPLGYPTTDEEAGSGGVRYTRFQRGEIVWTAGAGARIVQGDIDTKWAELGRTAWTGPPTTDEQKTADGVGRYNHFGPDASIYWSPATGAHAVGGAIRARWAALGWERSLLGYPTSEEQAGPGGSRYSTFQRGTIYWTAGAGTRVVMGDIDKRYQALGGPSWAGLPVTDEGGAPDGRGRFSHFASGSIYWTAATGAHGIKGAIRTLWGGMGWERSVLGYPIADEATLADGSKAQTFQRGVVYSGTTSGTHAIYGGILDSYRSLGGPTSRLGLPTGDEYSVAGGRAQEFEHGTARWTAATGAVTVTYR